MKPNSLEHLLQQQAPAPDPTARLAARRAALEEFQRVQAANAGAAKPARKSWFQALSAWARPSREQSHGSAIMAWNSRRMLLGGLASVCIALFGSLLVWNVKQQQPELTALPGAASSTPTAGAPVAAPLTAESGGATAGEPAAVGEAQPTQPQDGTALKSDSGQKSLAAAPVAVAKHREAPPPVAPVDEPKLQELQPVSPAPAAQEKDEELDDVTVTGMRSAPVAAMDAKRAPATVDVLPSESLEEIVTTGVRANRGAVTPHKGMTGVPVPGGGGSFSRKKVASNAPAAPPAPQARLAGQAVEGRDKFEHFELNSVKQVADEPVSTFSADVDTASYSFVRKQLMAGVLPQKDAVRVEEMVNYFDYSWPAAESRDKPFRPTVVVSDSPWGKGRKLIHIGIKGYELPERDRPDANLVMLLDVSGSMDEPDKLPLVKESMKLMLGSLKRTDTVAIVVYAGAAGMVLPPTPVGDKEKIVEALDRLQAGGSTAGAEGLELAYQLAEKSFRKDGVNRILLCTDGDFNVGIDSTNELKGFVERKREKGIFLSFLGFGMGNYRDELAQALAQNGNGVAAYIDTLGEAQKVLVQEAGASLSVSM